MVVGRPLNPDPSPPVKPLSGIGCCSVCQHLLGPGTAGGPDVRICSRHHPSVEQEWNSLANHLHTVGAPSRLALSPSLISPQSPFQEPLLSAAQSADSLVWKSGGQRLGRPGPSRDSWGTRGPELPRAGREPRNYHNYSPAFAAVASAATPSGERPRPGRAWEPPRSPPREAVAASWGASPGARDG